MSYLLCLKDTHNVKQFIALRHVILYPSKLNARQTIEFTKRIRLINKLLSYYLRILHEKFLGHKIVHNITQCTPDSVTEFCLEIKNFANKQIFKFIFFILTKMECEILKNIYLKFIKILSLQRNIPLNKSFTPTAPSQN